jgi:adiponectin receptor
MSRCATDVDLATNPGIDPNDCSSCVLQCIGAAKQQTTTLNYMVYRALGLFSRGLELTNLRDIPAWMRGYANQHIHTGYRVNYTFRMLLRSLFMVHNETGNVWTHLLGFLLVVAIAGDAFYRVLDVSFMTYFSFFVYVGSALWCLGASTVYHLFWMHSDPVNKTTLFCDHFGISALITGSFVPLIAFLFTCHPTLQYFYGGVTVLVGAFGLIMPWTSRFHTWYWRRLATYLGSSAVGLIPAVHACFIVPNTPVTRPVFYGFLLMLFFYIVGMLIYILHAPERWFPGRFDYLCSSHQLWHVFVVAACVVHFFTCLGIYQRHELPHC